MRIFTYLLLIVFPAIYASNASAHTDEAVNVKPFVVPEVKSWEGGQGFLALSGRIVVKSKELVEVASDLSADYEEMFGSALMIVQEDRLDVGDIVLSLNSKSDLGTEGYEMCIDSQVTIAAETARGVFWGTRTLLQIAEQQVSGELPRGNIKDKPEYELRGLMLDCGRKYIPMNYLQKLVKVMAYYKMNTLQVHLNDNGFKQFFGDDWARTQAAFRLECDTYPGLTAKDGFYSKKDFIDFQKHAEANFVEVIPEIDTPAHSLAFTHYKSSLASKEYGEDHLDLFNPEVYEFMDSLFREYLAGEEPVFLGKRVHIGTDEYSNADPEVVEAFRAYTDHYIRLVEEYDKQAVVWGALTHADGATSVKSENVVMDIWYNGYAEPTEMKEQGYKLVSIPDESVYIVPAAGYYYDYLECEELYESWTPATFGNKTFEENDPAILGGMFAVWNDHAGNGISIKDIHHRLFPALQTLSTKCWSGKETHLPFKDFNRQRLLLSEAPGVNELGLLGKPGQTVLTKDTLRSGEELAFEEIGYNYAVSFVVECASPEGESKGTELFRSAGAVVYLADPVEGKLGFARDGYLNTFDYTVQPGVKDTLTIEGTNKATRLLVNGKVRDALGPVTLYALHEKDKAHFQIPTDSDFVRTSPCPTNSEPFDPVEGASPYVPEMYIPSEKMYYQRTLVFPLRKVGAFKSNITSLTVKQAEEEKAPRPRRRSEKEID